MYHRNVKSERILTKLRVLDYEFLRQNCQISQENIIYYTSY